MTWAEHHTKSQSLADSAHEARRAGDINKAEELFASAAGEEVLALATLSDDKPRTLGIAAISATALWYKARKFQEAEQVAYEALARPALPAFAKNELRGLLQAIWNEKAQAEAGISFVPGQVVVSVRGGDVVSGGAPLDLILSKVQIVQSLFYRTAEFLKSVPFRTKGPPAKDVQEKYKPWLFQSVPGSYQFIVAVQKPIQAELFPSSDPEPELLTDTFLSILRAASEDAGDALAAVVPEPAYRKTFLKLTRNLAPTGKTFDEMEIRGTSDSTAVTLSPYSRKQISEAIRPARPVDASGNPTDISITGTLRAVHLENDWLEVVENGQSVKVFKVGEAVDDLIGPMVNHQVIVRVKMDRKQRYNFVDIEQEE